MKVIYVESKREFEVSKLEEHLDKLPENFVVATTAQYVHLMPKIAKLLKNTGKKFTLINASHAKYPGQILGCSIFFEKGPFFYIGEGLFHPKILALRSESDVYVYNPVNDVFFMMDKGDVDQMKRRMRGSFMKFKSSDRIGILVSTKPGQNRMATAKNLKKNLEKEGKKAYLMVSNTLDFNELMNYPDIDCYVNTMCPRIAYDETNKIEKSIINIDDIDMKL